MSALVICDFSKTFTASTVPSTWSSIAKSGILDEAYVVERDALYEANIAFEQAKNIPKTNNWFRAHAELLVKYQLSEPVLRDLVANPAYYEPRTWVADFLARVRVNGSKLVIVSSGFTKVIQLWFEIHGFDLDGITIYANEFLFAENGVASEIVGITRSPLDKFAEIDFQSKNFDSTIVIGDSLEDLPPPWVLSSNTRTYGFCDTEGIYDVTLTTKGSFDEINIA